MSKRILITGYSGHLGKEFVRRNKGTFEFVGLARTRTGLLDTELSWTMGEPMPKVTQAVDTVVHFAWSTDTAYCEDHKAQVLQSNLDGTLQLLDWAKENATRFVFISTGSVYSSNNEPSDEDAPHKPLDFYNLTKSLGEQLCNYYSSHLSVTSIRPIFPFGDGTKPGRLIDILYSRVKNEQAITLNQGGAPSTNPIYIDDFTGALSTVIHCPEIDRAYNFGGPEILSIRDIAIQIGEVLGQSPHFVESGNTVTDFAGKVDRLQKIYRFRFSFRDAIEQIARDRGDR